MTDRDTTTRTRARAPGVGGVFHRMAVHDRVLRPELRADHRSDHEMHEGWMQTGCRTAHVGSRLKPLIIQEGTAWKASLPAVLGKTRRTDDRGDRGNVGIIRSPIRASILPDQMRHWPHFSAPRWGQACSYRDLQMRDCLTSPRSPHRPSRCRPRGPPCRRS